MWGVSLEAFQPRVLHGMAAALPAAAPAAAAAGTATARMWPVASTLQAAKAEVWVHLAAAAVAGAVKVLAQLPGMAGEVVPVAVDTDTPG